MKTDNLCPRGNHGILAHEIYPNVAEWCLICGYRKYPGTENNVTGGGPGSNRRLTKTEKGRFTPIIRHLIETGYTNGEVIETLGCPRSLVEDVGRQVRKELRKNIDMQ